MVSVDGEHRHLMLPLNEYQSFSPETLGLGKLGNEAESFEVLAAIFDLEAFTRFCGQPDSHLFIPEFLEQLFDWLYSEIAARFAKNYTEDGVVLWGKFPFFAKFMGDGVLFLWDTVGLGAASLGNIIVNLYRVGQAYRTDFVPRLTGRYDQIPQRLRCGIARGEVVALGHGKDFVGPCINLAARLQEIGPISFAFSRKGFDPDQCFGGTWRQRFLLKRLAIRGLDRNELVLIPQDEFEQLPDPDKARFKEP